ncbi:MAG: hypothetical protein U0235_25240 [Polyangiaceae bacterium]
MMAHRKVSRAAAEPARAFEPARLVAAIAAAWAASADAKGVALEWGVSDDVPEVAVAQFEAVRAVLSALVRVALRATTRGAIVVVARGSEDGGVTFEVADTGAGTARPVQCESRDARRALLGHPDGELGTAVDAVLALGGRFAIESIPYRGTRCSVAVGASPRGSGTMLAAPRIG